MIITIGIILLPAFSTAATAAPVEHCYGVDHPDITYYNSFKGYWETIQALETYGNAVNIHNGLDAHGYYNSSAFVNNPSLAVGNNIGGDAIFYINAHGAPGRVICTDWYNGWRVSFLTADGTSDPRAYALQVRYGSTTDKLRWVRFAYFGSCYSAATDPDYGNLVSRAVNLGVDCALGFRGTIIVNRHKYFSERMILYYGMDPNNTVGACAASAVEDTRKVYGDYGGVDTYSLQGNAGIKLVPAAYGTY